MMAARLQMTPAAPPRRTLKAWRPASNDSRANKSRVDRLKSKTMTVVRLDGEMTRQSGG